MSELRSPRMTRMRTIKPEFFKHEGLYDLEQSSGLPVRLGLAGLWVCSDRDGLFEWQPRRLKIEIFPYDDLDFGKVLDALLEGGFIQKYEVDGKLYGCIPTWHKHQSPNGREPASGLPTPPNFTRGPRVADASSTREARSAEFVIGSVNVNGNVEGNVNGNGNAIQPEAVGNLQSHSPLPSFHSPNTNRIQHSHPQPKPVPSVTDDLEWEFLPVPQKLARLFYESLPQETRAAAPAKWESLWSKDLEKIHDEFRIVDAVIQFVQRSKWKKFIVRASTFVEKYPEIKAAWKLAGKRTENKANASGPTVPDEFALTSKERMRLGRPAECDHGIVIGAGCAACDGEFE